MEHYSLAVLSNTAARHLARDRGDIYSMTVMSYRESESCFWLMPVWPSAGAAEENTTESSCTDEQAAQLLLELRYSDSIDGRRDSTLPLEAQVEKVQQQHERPQSPSSTGWSSTGAVGSTESMIEKPSLSSPISLRPLLNAHVTPLDECANKYTSDHLMWCHNASSRLADVVGVAAQPSHLRQYSNASAQHVNGITELIDQLQRAF
ncbi:hypothetical protein BKA67DRAFT_664721 [Truncatella angustata]|uniref:Uncharacterized protein n=1 Tax=Truncatella angustata TaxID=152316 RepID=A0A9P8RK07_9PEZI|nr:uncharacterized protein BKA67DRAFT_664721 [Truncatella angustata]KAH6645703.1 hypothetical protein BKA67DRAFT_664721 [Truncatella angustata]